jgi:hypothetical protein
MSREHRQTDRAEGPEELKIARVVKAIPEESPSLAWRSALNERVLAVAKKKDRRRFWARIWMPAAGLGTSGALAVLAFSVWVGGVKPEGVPATGTSLEAAMLTVHKENVQFAEIAGPGLSETDAVPTRQRVPAGNEWKEADLEAL